MKVPLPNERRLRMSLVRIALFLFVLCVPASSQEQTMGVGRGIICGTPQQAVRFARLRSDGKDANVALRTVNDEIAGACSFGMVMFTKDVPVAELSVNGRPVSVVEITVHAFSYGATWKDAPDVVRYTIVMEKGLIA
jgi:hypothetical protein